MLSSDDDCFGLWSGLPKAKGSGHLHLCDVDGGVEALVGGDPEVGGPRGPDSRVLEKRDQKTISSSHNCLM